MATFSKKNIQKLVERGDLIKHYPTTATAITLHSFLHNGKKYGWNSDIKYFVRLD